MPHPGIDSGWTFYRFPIVLHAGGRLENSFTLRSNPAESLRPVIPWPYWRAVALFQEKIWSDSSVPPSLTQLLCVERKGARTCPSLTTRGYLKQSTNRPGQIAQSYTTRRTPPAQEGPRHVGLRREGSHLTRLNRWRPHARQSDDYPLP